MRLKIDQSFRRFLLMGQSDKFGDWRTYYVVRKESRRRVSIICRNGLELWPLSGQVVDAKLSLALGTPGLVREEDIGLKYIKLTIFQVLSGKYGVTLRQILKNAPKTDD